MVAKAMTGAISPLGVRTLPIKSELTLCQMPKFSRRYSLANKFSRPRQFRFDLWPLATNEAVRAVLREVYVQVSTDRTARTGIMFYSTRGFYAS